MPPEDRELENEDERFAIYGRKMFIGEIRRLAEENERLKLRVLTAAGDDLCRLTQGEINEMSLGKVKIPPKEEFIASCVRFHEQTAGEIGVLPNCLTLAQMIAENERLRTENAELRNTVRQYERLTTHSENYRIPSGEKVFYIDNLRGEEWAILAIDTTENNAKSEYLSGRFDSPLLALQAIEAIEQQEETDELQGRHNF